MFVLLKGRILRHQMQSTHQSPIHQVQALNRRTVAEALLFPVLQLGMQKHMSFSEFFVSKWLKVLNKIISVIKCF